MSYTLNLFDGTKLNLGDLQIRGVSGSKIMQDIKKYLAWLELPTVQRSDNPIIQEYVGFQIRQSTIEEQLKSSLTAERKAKLEADLESIDKARSDFTETNSMVIAQCLSDENYDIDKAYDIFIRLLKNLKPDMNESYLDADNYSYDEVLEFLKTVNSVKNNDMKSFLTASST